MIIDVPYWANNLQIVDIWQLGNPTGIVTEPVRYDHALGVAPPVEPLVHWVRHVTVGTNSLAWLARNSPEKICIPYLIPPTRNFVVYKMIPDGTRCHHIGDAEWNGHTEAWLGPRCSGFEIENIGNFRTEILDEQYIKAGMIYAYECALNHMRDYNILDHSNIAIPHGRRRDPQAGLFRESKFWNVVLQVREAWPWPIPVWYG